MLQINTPQTALPSYSSSTRDLTDRGNRAQDGRTGGAYPYALVVKVGPIVSLIPFIIKKRNRKSRKELGIFSQFFALFSRCVREEMEDLGL